MFICGYSICSHPCHLRARSARARGSGVCCEGRICQDPTSQTQRLASSGPPCARSKARARLLHPRASLSRPSRPGGAAGPDHAAAGGEGALYVLFLALRLALPCSISLKCPRRYSGFPWQKCPIPISADQSACSITSSTSRAAAHGDQRRCSSSRGDDKKHTVKVREQNPGSYFWKLTVVGKLFSMTGANCSFRCSKAVGNLVAVETVFFVLNTRDEEMEPEATSEENNIAGNPEFWDLVGSWRGAGLSCSPAAAGISGIPSCFPVSWLPAARPKPPRGIESRRSRDPGKSLPQNQHRGMIFLSHPCCRRVVLDAMEQAAQTLTNASISSVLFTNTHRCVGEGNPLYFQGGGQRFPAPSGFQEVETLNGC
eukprot:gene22598-biopygen17749